MANVKKILAWTMVAATLTLLAASSASAFGFGTNKFEKEVEKEQGAVKLARETVQGDYGLITTEELKQLIDSGKDILIIDTMPYEDSYKKNHIPGAKQFLFPIPAMETWDSKETDGKSQDRHRKFQGASLDKKRYLLIVESNFMLYKQCFLKSAWFLLLSIFHKTDIFSL
jgi:rhodanese-related sulfurtransferase